VGSADEVLRDPAVVASYLGSHSPAAAGGVARASAGAGGHRDRGGLRGASGTAGRPGSSPTTSTSCAWPTRPSPTSAAASPGTAAAAAAERPTRSGRRPPALAPGVGAAVPTPAREDVERPDGRRPEHRDPHRLDRQGRAPRATAHRPRGVGSATTSRTGCTGSTAGAHNPGCPSSSASPARLRRGGPRGKPSSAGTPTTATGPHTPTLRHWLLTVPGRILRHARGLTLRLPAGHTAITDALQRVRALPPPG